MSVLESIDDLVTDTLTVQRHVQGTFTNGVYIPAAPTTFTIDAVVQPAYNINRVVGGADLHALVDDQKAFDVRQLHTRTLLKTRTPSSDPDVILSYEGASWTVARVEKWTLDGESHYHCIITRSTGGGS